MRSKAEFDRYGQNYNEMLRDPVRDAFVRSTKFYHRRKWELIRDFLQKYALAARGLAWLDVGCGKCELLNYGSSHFGRVVGCDPSREMVRDSGGIEVHLQEAPAVLPFPDETFDFTTAVCVYHHVDSESRIPLTREVQRVLRPNGIFCMIEHNPLNPVTRLIVSRSPIDVDAHMLTAQTARLCAATAALKHLETQYFLYLPEKYYDKMVALERSLRKLPLGGQFAMFAKK